MVQTAGRGHDGTVRAPTMSGGVCRATAQGRVARLLMACLDGAPSRHSRGIAPWMRPDGACVGARVSLRVYDPVTTVREMRCACVSALVRECACVVADAAGVGAGAASACIECVRRGAVVALAGAVTRRRGAHDGLSLSITPVHVDE